MLTLTSMPCIMMGVCPVAGCCSCCSIMDLLWMMPPKATPGSSHVICHAVHALPVLIADRHASPQGFVQTITRRTINFTTGSLQLSHCHQTTDDVGAAHVCST